MEVNRYLQNPARVDRWNEGGAVAANGGTEWNLLLPRDTYLFGTADDDAWEADFPASAAPSPTPTARPTTSKVLHHPDDARHSQEPPRQAVG
jgi:hypothetical protein